MCVAKAISRFTMGGGDRYIPISLFLLAMCFESLTYTQSNTESKENNENRVCAINLPTDQPTGNNRHALFQICENASTVRVSGCQKWAKLAFPPRSSFSFAEVLSNELSRDFQFDREPSLG